MNSTTKVLDPNNPMAPESYQGALGLPLHWLHEQSGTLRIVILNYLERRFMSEDEQLYLFAYLRHYIHAPCWLEKFPNRDMTPCHRKLITELRTMADEIRNIEDVDEFIKMALKGSLDPL